MYSFFRDSLFVVAALLNIVSLEAQTPRAYFKFDGTLTDSSAAGIITSVTQSGSVTFTTDRNGQANQAVAFAGSSSLRLVAGALVDNSNQALGLRNAGGGNTSFTLAAWVYFNSVSGQGYNTVFGNRGSGAGTLHAGLGSNNDKAHFGFDGNDANGATAAIAAGQWYHFAFVYDAAATTQQIFINGIPEITRFSASNTLKADDLLLGNWGSVTSNSNDLIGRLDDVAIFNTALDGSKIQALFDGRDANNLAAPYSAPKMPGVTGVADRWGVREIQNYPGIPYGTLVNAERILRTYPNAPGGTAFTYQAPVINFSDDQGPGNLGNFPNEADLATNTGAADDNICMIAKGTVRITAEDDYTFGFLGDDGSRLRVLNQQFISSTRIGTGNIADPAHSGDSIFFPNGTGNSATLGVVHLVPGDYPIEFVWWEATGGCSGEVFAARGAKTSIESSFQLIGNPAAGGLQLVRDPDTLPQIVSLTANGGSTLYVHSGTPANFTLSWQTNAIPTTVSINQGIGTVAQTGSLNIPAPTQTTTYIITATQGADVATRSVTVFLDSAPNIASFIADDSKVGVGANVRLNWSVSGASSLLLQPGNLDVTGQTSRLVTPTTNTTYTLIATNPSGTTQKSAGVEVGTLPVIAAFSVTDASPLYGSETVLSWDVSGATVPLNVDQGIGTLSGTSGSLTILPLQTATYTLSATNDYGTTTAAVAVTMPTPIGVTASGFSARRVSATSSTPFPFAGQGYLQSAVSLLAGQNAGAQSVQNNIVTVNFADGADGDYTSGNSAFPGGGGDNFAVRITATLVVNTPGEYTFTVNSDDGARLRVDGQDVISDDSTHLPSANSGRIFLSKPTSQLELVYYDATGGAEVELGWIRPNGNWQLLGIAAAAPPVVRGQVLISEFMAENSGTVVDEDNESSDWIEIWNSTPTATNLLGYYLTDDPAVPNKWPFPARSLSANGYLVVFASLKDRRDPAATLHTNFKLETTGEYLALNHDNGAGGFQVVSEFGPTYPPQREDISYGSADSEGYIGYMEVPTPGQPNAATVTGFAASPGFSHPRGRYSAAFNLTLSTATAGATIRYTTDGSTPTPNRGTIYTNPFPISGTTVVRAAVYKTGWKASDVATQTYLFVDDVVAQTTNTAIVRGFPAGAVNGQVFRYGLSLANVTSGGGSLASLKSALAAAPTVCLSTDVGNLVDPANGIYVNPGRHGLFWERPVSMEYISSQGTSEFQIDCGIRIRGGASRSAGNPKHGFHLYFRNLYDGNLKYRLFGANGASEFNQIDLRCEQNYSWSKDNSSENTLMREQWSRLSQRDMGQPYARTAYFHLYLNGIYWGVFDFEERTEAAFGETYLGGRKDNVDTVKSAGSSGSYNTEMTDGNFAAWQSLNNQAIALKNDASETGRTAKFMQMRGLNPDGGRNTALPILLDVDNLIDYLLVIFYDGSYDAPMSTFLANASNNWFGVRDRSGARGWAFFAHDNEHGMDSRAKVGDSYNRVGPWGGTGVNNWGQTQYGSREMFNKSNPHYIHELLAYSAEYRQRFADRVQHHFFNGGALTTAAATARLNGLAALVDPIIHAEAARWGSTGLNRNTWLSAKSTVQSFINNGGTSKSGETVFATQQRSLLLLTQLRGYTDAGAKPLFTPATFSAPVLSGPFGGAVSSPYSFDITNANGATGTLYYTLNGSDPRAVGGGIAAGTLTGASPINVILNNTSTVLARVYNSATLQWSPLTEAEYLVGALATSANLVVSKIHYNPTSDADLEEFVEVMNIGGVTIDLTNVRFMLGIQFDFPTGFRLAPGGRALIVRNLVAFTAAYPAVPADLIAGVFLNETNLDSGGERLQLLDSNNLVIRDFNYDDEDGWPTAPDGNGPSLVLKRPETNPDHSSPANWRASVDGGGSPGVSDALHYANWAAANGMTDPFADIDRDGWSSIVEYALGSDPNIPSLSNAPTFGTQTVNVNGVVSDYLTMSFTRPLGRDDVSYGVEAATALTSWLPAVHVATVPGARNETVTYRHPLPKVGAEKQFLRLSVSKLP